MFGDLSSLFDAETLPFSTQDLETLSEHASENEVTKTDFGKTDKSNFMGNTLETQDLDQSQLKKHKEAYGEGFYKGRKSFV